MNTDIMNEISSSLNITNKQVETVLKLLEEGTTYLL